MNVKWLGNGIVFIIKLLFICFDLTCVIVCTALAWHNDHNTRNDRNDDFSFYTIGVREGFFTARSRLILCGVVKGAGILIIIKSLHRTLLNFRMRFDISFRKLFFVRFTHRVSLLETYIFCM